MISASFFDSLLQRYPLSTVSPENKRRYYRAAKMSKAEVMLILIMFHASGYRCLKHYYLEYVCVHLRHLFPRLVSYNRFMELEKDVALPLAVFIKRVLLDVQGLVLWTVLPYGSAAINAF